MKPLQKELEKVLLQEKIHWQQRAKRHWLQEGDKNTSFFHQSTKNRRIHNLIDKITDEYGVTHTREHKIEACAVNFFSSLFTSSNPSWEAIDKALRFVEPKVDKEMNLRLDAKFNEEEIKKPLSISAR